MDRSGGEDMPVSLETMNFDNRTVRSLPMDQEEENFTRQVSGSCFSRVKPTPCKNPKTVSFSLSAMQLLDLDQAQCERDDLAEYFSGNKILPGSQPAAHCYCGHQFGSFAGQLGDGAAMYLGEIINKKKERWEIQLKGAGLTPYSRSADGRKVLRSSIREYLCSEAMFYLGIPTTRAGCCVTSDSTVVRDIFYDGNPIREKCTIVLRIAQTFLRIGSFEICRGTDMMTGRRGPSAGQVEILRQLLDYTISSFYPEIAESSCDQQTKYKNFFKELVTRTAQLVAKWQAVGFCHGVLNTDNTSIVGVTIDYGPYGFMDRFNPEYVCNGSDDGGRYSYENQPKVLKWNLLKFVEALKNVISEKELLPILDEYDAEFEEAYIEIMRKKLGLMTSCDTDRDLVDKFFKAMHDTSGDFTNCFRCLNTLELHSESDCEAQQKKLLATLISHCSSVEELIELNKPSMGLEEIAKWSMNSQFLRLLGPAGSSILQELAKTEEYEKVRKMKPKDKMESDEKIWGEWVHTYMARIKSEMKDQASISDWQSARIAVMNATNPRYVLRNYIAQEAIAAAEKGNFSKVDEVLKLLSNPYADAVDKVVADDGAQLLHERVSTSETCRAAGDSYSAPPPIWAYSLKVT